MSRRKHAGAAAWAGALSLLAVDELPGDVTVARDLTAVIALQGLPCGKVVDARQQGADDYLATCDDGHHYRVFVNADGRVVVEKRD